MYRYILVYVGLYRYHTIAWYIPVHTGTYWYELGTYHWSGFQMFMMVWQLEQAMIIGPSSASEARPGGPLRTVTVTDAEQGRQSESESRVTPSPSDSGFQVC